MGRAPRENLEGGIYHVFARGNDRQPIFADDFDRRFYLRLLELVIGQKQWRCLAYCLMENHIHLLLETPEANLSLGMHQLHSRYASAFNQRHDRSGHVFQGRYGAVRIESDRQLCAAAVYVARNPVEAGMTDRADLWPWSSCRSTVMNRTPGWIDADRLLSFFGSRLLIARKQYASLALAPEQTSGAPAGDQAREI